MRGRRERFRRLVLLVMFSSDTEWYALELMNVSLLPAGTLYAVLAGLEADELVTSDWVLTPADGKRRRMYSLTEEGKDWVASEFTP